MYQKINENENVVGERLRIIRERLHVTLIEMGLLLGGKSEPTVLRYEKGESQIGVNDMMRLEEVGVNSCYLINRSESPFLNVDYWNMTKDKIKEVKTKLPKQGVKS